MSTSNRYTSGRRPLLWFVLLVSAVLGSACATQEKNINTDLNPVASIGARPDGSVRVDTQSKEVASLWASAERAISEDRPNIALELLYEALEIDGQNSLLWSRAAELQLDTLEPALAESYAVKSNAWAGDNRPLLYRNWLIIEHARSMRGDLLGVRSAHKQVQAFQYQ